MAYRSAGSPGGVDSKGEWSLGKAGGSRDGQGIQASKVVKSSGGGDPATFQVPVTTRKGMVAKSGEVAVVQEDYLAEETVVVLMLMAQAVVVVADILVVVVAQQMFGDLEVVAVLDI